MDNYAVTTSAKLSKINVLKKEIILSPKNVDNGFVNKISLQETEGLCIMQYLDNLSALILQTRYNSDSAIAKCSGLLQQMLSKKLDSPDFVQQSHSSTELSL